MKNYIMMASLLCASNAFAMEEDLKKFSEQQNSFHSSILANMKAENDRLLQESIARAQSNPNANIIHSYKSAIQQGAEEALNKKETKFSVDGIDYIISTNQSKEFTPGQVTFSTNFSSSMNNNNGSITTTSENKSSVKRQFRYAIPGTNTFLNYTVEQQ